jgi:hypothetical protein
MQAKPAGHQAGDRLEQEADRVAQAVVQGGESAPKIASTPSAAIQRQCDCGGTCTTCGTGDASVLQRKSDAKSPIAGAPPSVNHVLASPGRSIDSSTRAIMETRFAQDFSGVRIHTDSVAAGSAKDVSARAYTSGHHVVFAEGEFSPGTSRGNRLLAHELTHVVQQRAVGRSLQRQPMATEPHPITLSTLDYEHLCGCQPCLDPEDLPYNREIKEQHEQEKRAEQEREEKEDQYLHARLMKLRGDLDRGVDNGRYYSHYQILDALAPSGINIVRHYKCEASHTTEMEYQKCVITALYRYDFDWNQQHGMGGSQASPGDIAAVREQERKEADRKAGAEGLEYVTSSPAGAAGAAITSVFTDDPQKITAGAGIGVAVSGSFGSVLGALAHSGSYSPKVVGENKPLAVGDWRYAKPQITGEPAPTTTPGESPALDPWAEADEPETDSSEPRAGINWNPFRGKSLTHYLPYSGKLMATSKVRPAVGFLGLSTTAKGGRVWVSPVSVDHYHIEDLVTQLMKANPGKRIEIVTGVHGTGGGRTIKEEDFLVEDFGVAPASKDIEIHNEKTITDAQLKSVLESNNEVILAWCDSEFSRRIVKVLGMNLMKAPF